MKKSILYRHDFVPFRPSQFRYLRGNMATFGRRSGFMATLGLVFPLFNLLRHLDQRIVATCALILALLVPGCMTASSNPTIAAIENPNNQAKVVTGGVSIAAGRFLAKNPTYAAEVDAVADALVVAASGKPTAFTAGDVNAVLAKTSISSATQTELGTDIAQALDLFNTTFAITFPGVPVSYGIFLDATANGLYAATGKPTVPVPTIPWPPVTPTPTPTPTP